VTHVSRAAWNPRGVPHFGSEYRDQDWAGDVPIADLADRQHVVVASWQLQTIGYSRSAINRRVRAGRLFRRYRGVLSVGHRQLTRKGEWMAAVLACGPDALLSHRSAMALWDLRPTWGPPFDVLIPGRWRPGQRGIRVHCTRSLHPDDRDVVDGIPVTSIHRALLDYAETAPVQQVRLAIEAAERAELFDLNQLNALLARSSGRRGAKPLRAVLNEMHGEVAWTRSELERNFLALIREHGLPEPHTNVLVEGYLVDLYWPKQRVVGELDSWKFHRSRKQFHADRKRDTKLQIAAIPVIRVTQPRVEHEPLELVSDVRLILAAVAASGR
jgi:very-short-patch-repair endonuclease